MSACTNMQKTGYKIRILCDKLRMFRYIARMPNNDKEQLKTSDDYEIHR